MNDRPSGLICLLLLLVVFPAVSPVLAQPEDEPMDTTDIGGGLGALDEEQLVNEMFEQDWSAISDHELAGWTSKLVERRRYARARTLTEELLRRDIHSIPGHLMLGVILRLSDGNLPRALYHVKRSRQYLEQAHGRAPTDETMIRWHYSAIMELAQISGAMGLHEEKIRYLMEWETLYGPPMPAQLGWPLMRLRRYDEARSVVTEALALPDREDQEVIARTALCAIEAEQQQREASWLACRDAADLERRILESGPTPFTNAAEAALGVLKFDEAEKLILEGTKLFRRGTVSNPWLDLTHLYLAEGRISEALESVRQMFRWRRSQPAHIDEQNRSETELASAIFLTVAGRPQEAARVTSRVLARPDRTGYTSSESEQMESGNALVDSVAHRMAAELAVERASWSTFWDAAKAHLEARQKRSRAWSSGRRVASLLAARRILLATLRPYLAGSMEIPEWLEPEIVAFLGPGVVAAALKQARAEETQPEAEGYFLAYEAEVAWRQGAWRKALQSVDRALEALPGSEKLLRARLAGVGAQAARNSRQPQRALELFDRAMQLEPGVIRRLGLALPVSFEAPDRGLAQEAASYLRKSPRFDAVGPGWFRVQVRAEGGSGQACLFGPQGTRFACAEVSPRAGDEGEDMARRLAREFHDVAFAPRIDLTQADLQSLDGSPTAGGGRSSERLRSVLSDLVGLGGEEEQ